MRKDIRGQRYDGASNMRGEWNVLKALILRNCLAHQLQLASRRVDGGT